MQGVNTLTLLLLSNRNHSRVLFFLFMLSVANAPGKDISDFLSKGEVVKKVIFDSIYAVGNSPHGSCINRILVIKNGSVFKEYSPYPDGAYRIYDSSIESSFEQIIVKSRYVDKKGDEYNTKRLYVLDKHGNVLVDSRDNVIYTTLNFSNGNFIVVNTCSGFYRVYDKKGSLLINGNCSIQNAKPVKGEGDGQICFAYRKTDKGKYSLLVRYAPFGDYLCSPEVALFDDSGEVVFKKILNATNGQIQFIDSMFQSNKHKMFVLRICSLDRSNHTMNSIFVGIGYAGNLMWTTKAEKNNFVWDKRFVRDDTRYIKVNSESKTSDEYLDVLTGSINNAKHK